MKLPLALVAALCVSAAHAQTNPALRPEWGAMGQRVQAASASFAQSLSLDQSWSSYCQIKEARDEDAVPKDGLAPLGVSDWKSLDDDTFRAYLRSLETYRTSAVKLCLADVKARLRAAGAE